MKSERGLLVCAADKCLYIKEATIEDTKEPLANIINRYDRLTTVMYSVIPHHSDRDQR